MKCYITGKLEVAFNTAQSVMAKLLFEMPTNLHYTLIFIIQEYFISAANFLYKLFVLNNISCPQVGKYGGKAGGLCFYK